jgi:hypothetical protein
MVLRLVLVSLVTGLGVSPPASAELAGWTRTVQTWVDARLAEWIAQEAQDDETGATGDEAPVADSGLAITDEDLAALYVFEMELDLALASTTDEEAAPAPAADSGLVIADEELDALFVLEVEVDLALASTTGEEAAPAVAAPDLQGPSASDEDRAFDAVVEEMVGDFAQPETPVEVAEAAAIFEPYPLCDDLYPGLAYELNRQAEGLDTAEVDAPPPGPAPRETAGNQLSTAVRLTRDAVFAWINLLQSPALVTISR